MNLYIFIYVNGFARRLILTQRQKATWNGLNGMVQTMMTIAGSSLLAFDPRLSTYTLSRRGALKGVLN